MNTQLSPGERLIRCYRGEPIDRVPYGVGIGWQPWGETLARWRRETGKPELAPAAELGFDSGFTRPATLSGMHPEFEEQVIERSAEFVVTRNSRGITLRNRADGGSMPEFLNYPVKTRADWEALKRERLDPHRPGRVTENWDAFRARIRRTGEAVQVGCFPYGVFGTPRDFLGAEELLVSFYTEPAMVRDMMQHMTSVWLAVWEQVAAEVQIDHIHIWEDMSGRQGSLISPAMIRAFMMPCYDRIAAFARVHGVRILSVDTDGDCTELVPVMMEHGVNLFFPFEVQAGCDVLAFRKRHPTLGILGGLDKRALADGPAAIDREVERARRMVDLGRYVPCFDHLIPPDVPWKHFEYAAKCMRKVCGV
jgi:uroporphyrinogen decarboxylase